MTYKYNTYEDAVFALDNEFVQTYELLYSKINPIFWKDYNFVKEVVKRNGFAIKYADEKLRNNEELAKIAIKNNWQAYRFIDPALLYNPEILEFLGKEGKLDYIDCIDEITKKRMHIKTTEEIYFNYEEALKELKETLYLEETCQKISPKLWKNYDFVREAIKINGTLIKYADEKFRKDRGLAKIAVKNNCEAFKSIDISLMSGKRFISVLEENGKLNDPEIQILIKKAELMKRKEQELKAKEMIKKFIESDFNKDEFKRENRIREKTFNNYMEIVKDSDKDLYEKCKLRINNQNAEKDNIDKIYHIAVKSANNIVNGIKEGVIEKEEKRPFDALDYYDNTSYDYNELFTRVKGKVSEEDITILSDFFKRTKSVKNKLRKQAILSVKNMAMGEDGQLYEIVTSEDKEAIFKFLEQNGYPLREGTYYAAKKRYLNGYLDLSDYYNEKPKQRTR